MGYGNKKLESGHAASHPSPEPRTVYLSTTTGNEKNVIGTQPKPEACWKLEDGRFDFNSCFVRPEAKAELAELIALRAAHPGCPMSVFGHADPIGDESYNKSLSGRRAEAIYAILIHAAARWEAFFTAAPAGNTWGARETEMMLAAIGYNSGGTDAIKKYQQAKGLTADGVAGTNTRKALLPDYFAYLFPAACTKADFLNKGADSGLKGDLQGCSEFNPAMVFSASENASFAQPENQAKRNEENRVNRRVLIYLFPAGTSMPSDWPCPRFTEGVTGCKSRFFSDATVRLSNQATRREYSKTLDTFACRYYDRFANTSPCEGVAPAPKDPNAIVLATDSPHFVPGFEELELAYTISGPIDGVAGVVAVVKMLEDPKTEVARFPIPPPYLPAGKYMWKGDQVTDAAMDTYLSLKGSPYEIHLVLTETSGTPRESNRVKLEVLVHKVEMHLEMPASLPLSSDHRKAIQTLKDAIDKGKDKRLILDSNLFKTLDNEMEDDTFTSEYWAQWGLGPEMPLFAKVFLKTKAGKAERSQRVLKGAKVFWDMRLPGEIDQISALNGRGVHKEAKEFIQKVSAHKKDESEPPGMNAPVDLRGMRGKQSEREALPRLHWKELDAEWKMSKPASRVWGAYTECGLATYSDYDSAIYFQPGRMGGDEYFLKVCEDHTAEFDTTDQAAFDALPKNRQSREFEFAIWRRISVVKNYYIGSSTTALDLADLGEYTKASILFEAAPGLQAEQIKDEWKAAYQKAIAELGKKDNFILHACLDDPETFPARFKDFDDYKKDRKAADGKKADMFGAKNKKKYVELCDSAADTIYYEAAKEFPFPGQGMVMFRFGEFGTHNQVLNEATIGIGPFIENYTDRHHGAFFVFYPDNNKNKLVGTFIHEVGHTVFLAHARGHYSNPLDLPGGEQPAGWQKDAHDKEEYCVMSYHKDNPTNLCGLCELKLSGWDYMKINRKGEIS